MLAEFRVKGFKNFKEEINFKLDETKNYEFNKEAIKNGINKISMIYGGNGSGKSNLGLAIFDIVMSLTDKTKQLKYYENYLNLTDSVTEANFYYKFIFGEDVLEYSYSKTNKDILIAEEVLINNQKVITYNHKESKGEVKLKGTETLNTFLGNPISFVKYVMNNSSLEENKNNDIMRKFYDFVQNMLFFRSLRGNEYIGFMTGNGSITEKIDDSGKLKEFDNVFFRHIRQRHIKLPKGNIIRAQFYMQNITVKIFNLRDGVIYTLIRQISISLKIAQKSSDEIRRHVFWKKRVVLRKMHKRNQIGFIAVNCFLRKIPIL